MAIRQGLDVRLTIVGGVGFIPSYDKLIQAFPFPDRLQREQRISRERVPNLMRQHDLLAQPSDEENFGSSVAEAQACGLPVIVGATNGNADYLCSRDIHLANDRPETFARALHEMAMRKREGRFGTARESRELAEQEFFLPKVAQRLMDIVLQVAVPNTQRSCASA